MTIINARMKADILHHARRLATLTPPEEMVGVISKGGFHALENKASDRTCGFAIEPSALVPFEPIDALVHSHPGGPYYPSHHDMQQQIAMGVPWVIAVVPVPSEAALPEDVFIFGTPPSIADFGTDFATEFGTDFATDFLGGGYRHGVHDCYSLIRGYYQHHMGVALPDIPRGWDWWHEGGDLYAEWFAPLGFAPLAADTPLVKGDVFLAQIRSPVINHGGIWLEDGLILHHLAGASGYHPECYPKKEPAERWLKFVRHWIRHKSVQPHHPIS